MVPGMLPVGKFHQHCKVCCPHVLFCLFVFVFSVLFCLFCFVFCFVVNKICFVFVLCSFVLCFCVCVRIGVSGHGFCFLRFCSLCFLSMQYQIASLPVPPTHGEAYQISLQDAQ